MGGGECAADLRQAASAKVIVMPNKRLDNCTLSRISHRLAVMLPSPTLPETAAFPEPPSICSAEW